MKNALILFLLILTVISCAKENDQNEQLQSATSLLMATHYNTDPNYTFEYDDQNRLVKCITNGGFETKEYFYNPDGSFSGFKETTQGNAIYPIRRFNVNVNLPTEISGEFNLYDPNDVLDPNHTSEYIYEIDNSLLKSFSQISSSGIYKKSFEHNNDGNLTAIQLIEDPDNGHLYRMEFYNWDDKNNTNIFASSLQTYPAFDIIPDVKISNHNMLDQKQLYQNVSCCETSQVNYEYNAFDQVTKIYTISGDVYDEDGNIIIQGGEEVVIATFDYEVIE